jgi:hypothetical protein
MLTVCPALYQSPTNKVKSPSGLRYGTGMAGRWYTVKAPKPPDALCMPTVGKYVLNQFDPSVGSCVCSLKLAG